MRRLLSILLALGLVLSFSLVTAVPAIAQPYDVWVDDDNCPGPGTGTPGDPFCSIQDGIDAIDPAGGTVHVAAGTYPESINLRDGVDVLGAGIGASIIDGTGYYHVVTAININASPTALDGFTITGGDANDIADPDDDGGGMYISNCDSSMTISNCRFTLNNADDQGGGMYNCNNSSPTVTLCEFSFNTATWHGGGMYNDNSDPTVTNCYFAGNTANDRGGGIGGAFSDATVTDCTFMGNAAANYGGGMYNFNNSSPTVTNCIFWDNTSVFLNGGGMCNFTDSSPVVTNCTFWENTAAQDGGGMYNYDACSPPITNCTFYDNTANQDGGGIYCSLNNSSPEITNNIITSNTATTGTGGGIWADGVTSNPDIDYNDVYLNIATANPDYSGCAPDIGNINADPEFASPGTGDFHLETSPTFSPCIDTGDNAAVPGGVTTDFEGDPRIWDGDGDTTATVDMGVDESYLAPPMGWADSATYHTDENVTVSGSGFLPGVPVYVSVVNDGTWTGGESIGADVGDGMDILTTGGSGNITGQTIWTNPLTQGDYDVVFDTGNDGTYDFAVDAVDDPGVPGFTVLNYAPNDPTNLGPAAYVGGGWVDDDTPTLTFDQSDDDVNDTVLYRIQIDDTAGFTSPVVDYESALLAQGGASFTVGQAEGGGTYNQGSAGQTLGEGDYYWRVRSTDEWGANSGWVEANGGAVAFRLDTSAEGAGTSDDAGTVKDEFSQNEDVYVYGIGFTPDANGQIDVYVVGDRAWTSGDIITDYNVILMTQINTVGGVITPDPALVWAAPLDVGEYDVVFDVDQDAIYNDIPDFVDNPHDPGFIVLAPGVAARMVGGEVYPIDKAALLLPWLGLALALILAAGSLILVRRQRP